jgi:hypothetical protein
MKNTTIPITATIVFSAAVAVLNVAQNEPSRLHAIGFQTSGQSCYQKTISPGCPQGWYGEVDENRNKKDPATLPLGAQAWNCLGTEARETLVSAERGYSVFTLTQPFCTVSEYCEVTIKNGAKTWESTTGPAANIKGRGKCGNYIKVDLNQSCVTSG